MRLAGSVPLFSDGLAYVIDGGGSLVVIDGKTGESVFQQAKEKDLKGPNASPAIAGGMVFIPNTKGEIRVFKAGRKPELVATNPSDSGASSPFFVGNRVYLTSTKMLYAISTK